MLHGVPNVCKHVEAILPKHSGFDKPLNAVWTTDEFTSFISEIRESLESLFFDKQSRQGFVHDVCPTAIYSKVLGHLTRAF